MPLFSGGQKAVNSRGPPVLKQGRLETNPITKFRTGGLIIRDHFSGVLF